MGHQELFTLAVAIAIVVIIGRTLASRVEVPEAVILVLLGIVVSAIPEVPRIYLPPNVVLMLFVPPLVYNAAFLSAPRETRENAIPITALAVGATSVTMVGVAVVARQILPALGWAPALAFAAAVAPTDPVAATSVMSRLGAPQRVNTILEGEGLINDGVALTAFGLASEAMSHSFTAAHSLLRLIEVVFGGVAYGLAVGVVAARVRRHIRDPSTQILVSLITPFIAYIPADQLNVSGVLATVVTGGYLGTRAEGLIQPASRIGGTMFWRTLSFILESALFVLLGLELRAVLGTSSGVTSVALLAAMSAAVVAVVIALRLGWELLVSPLGRFLPGRHSAFARNPWQHRFLIGWAGMRGAISLAIAFSIPATLHGRPFGDRGTLIFVAAVVVAATLIGQGLTLAPLIRRLGLAQSEKRQRAEAAARGKVTEAGLARLDELAEAEEVDEETAGMYRQMLEMRLDRVRAVLGDVDKEDVIDTRRIRRELIRAQRDKLNDMYRKGKISDDIRRTISRTIDLQEQRPPP